MVNSTGEDLGTRSGPSVAIVIVTRNRCDDLLRLLGDLSAQEAPPERIIVVDNGSEPEQFGHATRVFPLTEWVSLPVNTGLSNGRNVGLARANEDVIVFMDDDLRVFDPHFVGKVRQLLTERPEIDVLSFGLVDGYWSAASAPRGARGFTLQELRRTAAEDQSPLEPALFYEWFLFGGACAIRRRVFDRVGAFDPSFMYGGEEWDFALRCHAADLRLARCTSLWVAHVRSPAVRSRAERDLILRNMLVAQSRFLPAPDLCAFLILQALTSIAIGIRRHRAQRTIAVLLDVARSWRTEVSPKRRALSSAVMRRWYFLRSHQPVTWPEDGTYRGSWWRFYLSRAVVRQRRERPTAYIAMWESDINA
jgi:GT2 family glycosyltransferase